jgi:hypothetical protein
VSGDPSPEEEERGAGSPQGGALSKPPSSENRSGSCRINRRSLADNSTEDRLAAMIYWDFQPAVAHFFFK